MKWRACFSGCCRACFFFWGGRGDDILVDRPFGWNFRHVSICLSRNSTFWTCWSLLAFLSLEWKDLIAGFFISSTVWRYYWQDSQLQDDIIEGQGGLMKLRLEMWTTRNWLYLLMSFKIINHHFYSEKSSGCFSGFCKHGNLRWPLKLEVSAQGPRVVLVEL